MQEGKCGPGVLGDSDVFEDLAETQAWGGGRDWSCRTSKATSKSRDMALKPVQCQQEVKVEADDMGGHTQGHYSRKRRVPSPCARGGTEAQ